MIKPSQADAEANATAAQPDSEIAPIASGWRARLMKKKGDRRIPLSILANAITALEYAPEWEHVLGWNESSRSTVAMSRPPWRCDRTIPFEWTGDDDVRVADWLQHQQILVGKDIAAQAVQIVAQKRPFHPVIDYLDELDWDGASRIDDWLGRYLGVHLNLYTRNVGPRILIGAVARIFSPGCKLDTVPVLEGLQGERKSTVTFPPNPFN